MLATRDETAAKFAKFVKKANGHSYIVYEAFTKIENPTDAHIEQYITQKLEELAQKKLDDVA